MNKMIPILSLMLLTTILFVHAEEGLVSVDTFRVYVADSSQRVDWDDEDDIQAEPGETLEIQMILQNDYNSSVDVEVKSSLDLINVLNREKDIEIDTKDDYSFVFSYFIPENTKEGYYELSYIYEYTVNNGSQNINYEHERLFLVEVRKPDIDREEILTNLTKQLVNMQEENKKLTELLYNESKSKDELIDCKEQLAIYTTSGDINGDLKDKYDICESIRQQKEQQLASCQATLTSRITNEQCENKINQAELILQQQFSKKNGQYIMFAVVLFLVYNHFKKKKDTPGGKGEGQSIYGATWKG